VKLTQWCALRGEIADETGEDFFGSTVTPYELGIPKRLLKGKRNAKGPNAV
jgi:hypothetical protein